MALVFFNVGVELGQLAFVLTIVLFEQAICRVYINWPVWLKLTPGYAVGIIGAFWTFERAGVLLG